MQISTQNMSYYKIYDKVKKNSFYRLMIRISTYNLQLYNSKILEKEITYNMTKKAQRNDQRSNDKE